MSLQNAVQCDMRHDYCRKTAKYLHAGQNIFRSCGSPNYETIPNAVNQSMEDWYREYKDVPSMEAIHRLGTVKAQRQIGHFTQVIQSRANRIGCSMVKYINQRDWRCVLITCNYAVGNIAPKSAYKIGAPASECKTGKHPKYPGLCSEKEDYSQHEEGELFINRDAAPSPVVAQWVKDGKKVNLGGTIAKSVSEEKKSAGPAAKRVHLQSSGFESIENLKLPKDFYQNYKPEVDSEGELVYRVDAKTVLINGKPTKILAKVNGQPISQLEALRF